MSYPGEGLYPPAREKMDPADYERVPVGNFVEGIIKEIQHDASHQFKGEHAKISAAVRFKFELQGLKFPHYSRWMTFSYGEKANLYNKYLLPLVEGAKEDMQFDIKKLEGFPIKMVWIDDPKNPAYQSIQLILPAVKKLDTKGEVPKLNPKFEESVPDDEEVPF